MTVADTLDTIGPSWLDGVLRASGASGAEAVEVSLEPLTFAGATTDMARVRVSYAPSGSPGPASLIAKIRGRDELRAQMDATLGLFAREACFYRELAARLPIRTPKAVHIGDGDREPLLLEDLGALRLGDQSQGLTLADAEACMDALADLHATFWEAPDLDAGWLARPTEGTIQGLTAQLMATGTPALRERFGDMVPAGVAAAIPDTAAGWAQLVHRIGHGPHTLVHNDCRLDNLFFADDGSPVFVDWQLVARSRGSQDLANLLAGSMEPELLSAHWRSLVERYHARLVAGGVRSYSLERCIVHYRQNLIWPLGQGLALLGALGPSDTRGVGPKIISRAIPHIVELETFDALLEED